MILGAVNFLDIAYTGEWTAYNDLHKYFNHSIINHGKKEYINGNIKNLT
jgi:hypothetical protein